MKTVLLSLIIAVAVLSTRAESQKPSHDDLLNIYRSANGQNWNSFQHPNGTVYDCVDRQNGSVVDWAVNELFKRAKGEAI